MSATEPPRYVIILCNCNEGHQTFAAFFKGKWRCCDCAAPTKVAW